MTTLNPGTIRHTVVFTLKHPEGSEEERRFLEKAESLAAIPGVEAYELMNEISPKNDYRYGISMEFSDQAAYDGYNQHPDHVAFVQERWLEEVDDFLELDYRSRPS
jgi:quinol monooxygenase YgiN